MAADLLLHGWDVCAPYCNSCPFDLLIWKDGRALRVQVKAAVERKGEIRHGRLNGEFEVLALVLPDCIIYRPEVF